MSTQAISWPELVETIGEDMATVLCAQYGGVSKYIPSDFTRGDLLPLLGIYAATALSARYGGSTLDLPNAVNKAQPTKARILLLLAAGWPVRRIAIECKTTERWVKVVKQQSSRRQVTKTLPLCFG